MILSLIVAISVNNVMGSNNKLPWHLPADLKYFKNLTWGLPVIMGRKTFESMGKPLPGRTNIVITRTAGLEYEGAIVTNSLQEALDEAEKKQVREAFIIGGAEIFLQSLPYAQKLYLTKIHHEFEGDVFFPEPDEQWQLVKNRDCEADEKNAWPHSFQLWTKKL